MLRASGGLLAISQDPLGRPGVLAMQITNSSDTSPAAAATTNIEQQAWTKELQNGGQAILFFNRAEHALNMSLAWESTGLVHGTRYRMTDVWGDRPPIVIDVPATRGIGEGHTVTVPAHGVAVLHAQPMTGILPL